MTLPQNDLHNTRDIGLWIKIWNSTNAMRGSGKDDEVKWCNTTAATKAQIVPEKSQMQLKNYAQDIT